MTDTDPILPRRTLHSLDDLQRHGLLTAAQAAPLSPLADQTVIAITPSVADLMDMADPADPIARQFIPSVDELTVQPQERSDPIGDAAYSPLAGLVHRYPDRVLIKPIMVCPVYCRFCFRRDMVGDADGTLSADQLDACFAYVAARPQIHEIILTGGDPLMLTAARLADLRRRAAAIAHVGVLRIHSRVPVADPQRVSDDLVAALVGDDHLGVWVSVHVNHPRELSGPAVSALRRLGRAGVSLISQSVLLRGVNDHVDVLADLFTALLRCGVKPYYLHHADMARGTSHFRLSIPEGQALVKALRGRISGLAQPHYVLDIPGGAGKSPLAESWWDGPSGQITDWQGGQHDYPPA